MPIPQPIDKELLEFFHTGSKKTYQKGEIILRAADTPQGIYLIETGHIKIYALTRQGTEQTHVFYLPGDIFPMIWAFKDAVRNVYYEAMQETVVWLVPKDKFKAFAESHARVAIGLLERAVDMFRLYAGRMDNLLYSNSHERTAYCMLSLVDRFGERQKNNGWLITVPMTHQDIANSINLSRETVSRCMERLQRKGIITYDAQHHIVVRDLAALTNIIGKDEVLGMWPHFVKFLDS
jgi:CRP/FNR family transcriptional regulator, cyclic AMP receptor protein